MIYLKTFKLSNHKISDDNIYPYSFLKNFSARPKAQIRIFHIPGFLFSVLYPPSLFPLSVSNTHVRLHRFEAPQKHQIIFQILHSFCVHLSLNKYCILQAILSILKFLTTIFFRTSSLEVYYQDYSVKSIIWHFIFRKLVMIWKFTGIKKAIPKIW